MLRPLPRFGIGDRVRFVIEPETGPVHIVRQVHEPEAGKGVYQMVAVDKLNDDGTRARLEGRFCVTQFVRVR